MTDTATSDIATLGGQTMGTTWSVKVVAPRNDDLHRLHAGIQQQLDQVVAQMSTWKADSDISRYNRAPTDSRHPLPADFGTVMQVALEIAEASGGAFDPTVGPLVALWGFGANGGVRHVPTDAQIQRQRTRVGWQRLQWQAGHALLQPGGVELDLSAIAKGYGVDKVHEHLRTRGIGSALIEVGGELLGYGYKPDGSAWRVLVESVPEEDAASALPARVLSLQGHAVATSGDRWHRFESEGQQYSHSFDPRVGRPVPRAPAAVTVVAQDAMHADAWATAMTVLGADDGLRLADASGLAVRFLIRTAHGLEERLSFAFRQQLEGA